MSQGFKLRFDEMRENDPTSVTNANAATDQSLPPYYEQPGYMRDVCFVWPDGRRLARSYGLLDGKDLRLEGAENKIILSFPSETITIKGYRLVALHTALMEQRALYIVVQDMRYESTADEHGLVVTDITIEPRKGS